MLPQLKLTKETLLLGFAVLLVLIVFILFVFIALNSQNNSTGQISSTQPALREVRHHLAPQQRREEAAQQLIKKNLSFRPIPEGC